MIFTAGEIVSGDHQQYQKDTFAADIHFCLVLGQKK